jgi:anti-sigma regulatory factor (Ser/Thr protein kinase)
MGAVADSSRSGAAPSLLEVPMATDALLELPPDQASPRKARAFIAAALHEWGCDGVADIATLLVSELVTNAVQHTRSTAVLTARYDEDGQVEVRVRDDGESLPQLKQTGPDDESGRGLMLVNALADRWGVEVMPFGGKTVYFAFDC